MCPGMWIIFKRCLLLTSFIINYIAFFYIIDYNCIRIKRVIYMENTKIILENGAQVDVYGIFYVFDLKYYLIYTLGESVDNDYIQLYMVQVCKEIQNTVEGPKETGYMIGIETSNQEEWSAVQSSVTKILDSKKTGIANTQIQYLTMDMLQNLKIVSKNKFKLLKSTLKDTFALDFGESQKELDSGGVNSSVSNKSNQIALQNVSSANQQQNDVIIDYRARFFEEQEKNRQLEEELKALQEKINSVKSIID